MKIRLKSTYEIQEVNETILKLYSSLPQIMSQPFWCHKVSIAEKIEYLKAIAYSRRNLMQTVQTTYPQLQDKSYSVGNIWVEYESEEATVVANKE